MPVYHIVLFKLKPGVTPKQLSQWSSLANAMVGKIPGGDEYIAMQDFVLLHLETNELVLPSSGLLKYDFGAPLPVTAARAKGYDMGLVAILEKPADVTVYAQHPAHLEVHKIRESLCDDTLAYDMEYDP